MERKSCELLLPWLSLTLLQYPVIEAHRATRETRLYSTPDIVTASTNRNLLQPTKMNKQRRKTQIKRILEDVNKGKHRDDSSSGEPSSSKSRAFLTNNLLRQQSASSSSSTKTDRSQLVDLVVEDREAENIERIRARKEGGPGWNEVPPKHFV